MSVSSSSNPSLLGVQFAPLLVTAAAANSTANSIPFNAKVVKVVGVTNDANDWVTLPPLAQVTDGHSITILNVAGANFELRTPTSSNEKINGQDSDGTKEALMTDTNVMTVTKINNTVGWMLEGRTAVGAFVSAIVPD
jgi:hypothetical protein